MIFIIKLKSKVAVVLCGFGILLGGGCIKADSDYNKKVNIVNDFHVKINPYFSEKDKYYEVIIWSKENKEAFPSDPKDGDTDISYYHSAPFSASDIKSPGKWYKIMNKWKKTSNDILENGAHTGSKIYNINYEDIPGKPTNIPLDKDLELRIDFDKGEEFARGIFKNKKSATEWAENMKKIFQKEYEK